MSARFLILGAALPAVLAAQDTTATKASLLSADRTAASGAAALRRAMAPGAAVLLDGENVLRGEAAWTARLAVLAAAPEGRAAWTPVHAVVSRDGGFGCTTGVLHLVPADPAKPTTGRYAACWRRENDSWRMLVLSRSAAPPSVQSLPDSLPGAPGSTGVAAGREGGGGAARRPRGIRNDRGRSPVCPLQRRLRRSRRRLFPVDRRRWHDARRSCSPRARTRADATGLRGVPGNRAVRVGADRRVDEGVGGRQSRFHHW